MNRKHILTGLLLLLSAWPSLAWNQTGHRIVAEIAWRNLTTAERTASSRLLRQHPHYALLLATNVPPGVSVDEWAFLNAATWPDMVRPSRRGDADKPSEITNYHRSPWHYINLPYVLPKDADRISASSFSIPPTNIVWALSNAIVILNDRHTPAPERAVSLCWVMHLVGDLHQPLHAATLLSEANPHGDQGGNLLGIADTSGIPLNLHSFWDQMMGSGEGYDAVFFVADSIARSAEYRPQTLAEYKRDQSIGSWADESLAAAVTFAYDEGHLKFAEWKEVQAGTVKASDVPRLKSTYLFNANDIARRRISLAGQRLADLLEKTF